jgi:LCP family protein required for cell wall assembly
MMASGSPKRWSRVVASAVLLTGLSYAALGSGMFGDILLPSVVATMATRNDVRAAELDAPDAGPVTYLLIGTDSREGLPPALGSFGPLTGARADSVALVTVGRDRPVKLLSLPRDLRVRVDGHGEQKLAGALDYGPTAVLRAVRRLTGAAIHHVVVVDFAGLAAAVDIVGGVDADIGRPVRDRVAHLDLAAGRQRLDGATALALLRSRRPEELHGGRWIAGSTGDAARISRLHALCASLLANARRAGVDPRQTSDALELRRHVTVDGGFDSDDAALLLDVLRGGGRVITAALPSEPTTPADEAVSPFPPARGRSVGYLRPRQPDADTVLADMALVRPPRHAPDTDGAA